MDTGYRDSFRKLGYELDSVRQDWSAENETGVCLSLWQGEMRFVDGAMEMDTRKDCGPIKSWAVAGRSKRLKHLISAYEKFDRWVDVVIREGNSWQEGVPTNPWIVEARKGHKFRLNALDRETGHFALRSEKYLKD